MDAATAKQILNKKEPVDLYDVIQPALKVAAIRDILVDGSFAKNETYRYNCVRVLYRALEQRPGLFYKYWDRFAEMIASPNGFHRSIAAQAVALLTPVDADCRLDPVFNQYLGLLDDPKVMVTHYFIGTLGWMYKARPDLRHRILTGLLSIDRTGHRPGQRDLLKADILSVFEQVFDLLTLQDRHKVQAFVEDQLQSSSPKTRKSAREFQKKHP